MNREKELSKEFPNKDGTTYIQSIDRFNSIKGTDMKKSTDGIKEFLIGLAVYGISVCGLWVLINYLLLS